MANKRIIELNERTTLNMSDYFIVDDSTGTRKLAMATLFDYMTYSSMVFVSELPTTDISESTIYLLPHSGSSTQWDEYIYRDNEWNVIGTSTIDLSAIYQTKTDNNLNTTSKQIVGAINELRSDTELKKIGNTGSAQFMTVNKKGNMVIVTFSAFSVDISTYPNGIIARDCPNARYNMMALANSTNGNMYRLTIDGNGTLAVQNYNGALIQSDVPYVTGQLIYFTN